MSTLPTIDAGTLGWVKSEIEDTATQARELLDRFEHNPADRSPMNLCATHLHQIYGTLTMVELDGAARLVHECEHLSQKVADGDVAWQAEVSTALRRAMDDLSSYLEGLQSSPVPSPLQLVEPINRVRGARELEPIPELELFSPDLAARPPEATAQSRVDAALFLKLADDLRIRFERALLGALRNPQDRGPLTEFSRVFNNLVSIDRRASLRQLWWIGAGLSEALLDGGLALDEKVRPILARINEQLKRLKDKSPAAKRRAPPDELIKRALLVLAYAESNGETVSRIRESFALNEWIDRGRQGALPDVEALSGALTRFAGEAEMDIEQAQNLLARYFSPQGGQREVLDRLGERFSALAQAARRHDLDVLEELVEALADVARAVGNGEVADTENASLQMAGAVLFIQDSGSGIRPGLEWRAQAEASTASLRAVIDNDAGLGNGPAPTMSPARVDNVSRAAATELRGELQYVEHALEQVAGGEAPPARLRGVEAHLKRIEGTLEILEQGSAAGLAESLRTAVRRVVEAENVSGRGLDALAMAVGTLTLCADELGAGNTLERHEVTIRRAMEELAGVGEGGRTAHLELVHPATAPAPADDDDGELSLADDVDSLLAELDAAPPAQSSPAALADEEDELVGIFFEEAAEILPAMQRDRSRWHDDPADGEALKDLRRGFHTLKGSGRFAGATSIAELSFAVEDLLNSVIDGETEDSDGIHGFVDRAVESLTAMVDARSVGEVMSLAPWQREAEQLKGAASADDDQALLLGEELKSLHGQAPPPAPPPASAGSAVDDVFLSELNGHVEVIASSVAEARRRFPDWEISEPLLRTAHTLRGVFRSVGLASPARMADGLDRLLQHKVRSHQALEEVDLVLVDQSGRLMRFASGRFGDSLTLSTELSMQFDDLATAFDQRIAYLGDLPAAPTVIDFDDEDDALALDDMPLAEVALEDDTADEPPALAAVSPGIGEDDELIEAFREEAQEILARLDTQVDRWRGGAPAGEALSAMRRELHTFKGGARAVGWSLLGDLAHHTETLLEDQRLTAASPGPVGSLVQEMHDLALMAVTNPSMAVAADLERLNRRVLDFDPAAEIEVGSLPLALADDGEAADEGVESPLETATVSAPPATAEQPPAAVFTPAAEAGEARAVRVRTEVLDELVSYAGEVSILRSRLQQQIAMVRSNLGELGETVRAFRDQLRDLEIESEAQMLATNERIREEGGAAEFDPLELDRFSRLQTLARNLGESLGGLTAIQAGISEFAGDAENTLQQQRHLSDSLQEGLLRTRMISFATLVPRLRHLTRQTAAELGRPVTLEISGDQVEVDRKVLDQMAASFEHMIRNAVSHGIEDAAARSQAGKPAGGTIRIGVEQDGNDIVIRIADDGRGIDRAAIAERARAIGLLRDGQELGEDDLVRVLATPGLSTASEVSQVSGRGVGMDVVSEMVRQLGGSIGVETSPGAGTTFVLRVPVTLAVSHALLVYAGEQMFAVPARLIINVLRLKKDDLEDGDEDADAYTYYNDRRIPVLNLANRLGLPFRASERGVANVIVVRAGLREIGLWVESISDTREVVVKPLGSMLQSIPGIGAVTLLGDGSIVLILDVPDLWQARRVRIAEDSYAASVTSSDQVTVMVVDDSMTVRNVMGRDLQNNGFEVILAKDGVDAIEQLRHTVPDIMLVDLEMPRMDGFELTRRVRVDDNLREVPILIITSRAGSRHREQATRLGANGYMSKPYRLDDLVRSIQGLTGDGAQAAALETVH